MKKIPILLLSMIPLMSACSDVPAGNIGIKVYLLGQDKGVDHEVLGVGRYYIGMNEQLYLFPTSEQTYNWTKSVHEGNAIDESISFTTKETLEVNADIGISYHIDVDKVANIFQKYRKGIDEITHLYVRNYVRDAFNNVASSMTVEEVNGAGKPELIAKVTKEISDQLAPQGIVVDKISLLGQFRLPASVQEAINSKIEATQHAQQRQNEIVEATASAEKVRAEAHGKAQAMLELARAEADSNALKQRSLSASLIQYEAVQKWNGELPTYMGGVAIPFLNLQK